MQQSLKWIAAGCLAIGILAGCSSREGSIPGPVESEAPPMPSMPAPPPPASASSDSVLSRTEVTIPEDGTVPHKPQPEAQSGLLTAGDYDDVLNPGLYKAYLDKVLQGELSGKQLPYVDANQRIAIRVVDRLGKPVPLARLTLKSDDGETELPLRTGANGMAYLYPQFDTLEAGMTVSVVANGQRTLSSTLPENLIEQGGELLIEVSGDRVAATKLDLLLTIDATGSMSDELVYLQKELEAILDRVKSANEGLDIRVGLIVYRDKGDEYVVRDFAFTSDFAALKADLNKQSAGGGGDMPEAMQDAMAKGLDFDWREDAVKVNLLVADAPPHDGDILQTWESATLSRSQGIHIVPLAASGVDKTAEFLMRAMGQITGGRYLFLTDDSGIGNPHAEPTVDCYVVTRLDALVTRVLSGLVSGERIEPEGDDVIRTVGNYRAGICKVEELSGQ